MDWTSAPNTEDASLEPAPQRFLRPQFSAVFSKFEAFLERERAQLPLWLSVAFGCGIAAWLALSGPAEWTGFILAVMAVSAAGLTIGATRLARSLIYGGMAMAAGCALIWWRADWVAAPTLSRPAMTSFQATVERLEVRAAKGDLRLTLRPQEPALPALVRVSLPEDLAPKGLGQGATVRIRARLQPPPPMALPGSHDFARANSIELVQRAGGHGLDNLRDRLGQHIRRQLPGPAGGIATALATGDQAAVGEEDAEAMRRSGLAHLLSVSGLHIAAVVGAAMFAALRILALSERLALHFNLVLVSAGIGAGAGVAYTLLTGMQVPTLRACIAALLVLGGIALGRESISLRLVAVGALIVLLFRPEAVAGASFQMSFAAVTVIIALHHWPPARRFLAARDELLPMRLMRGLAGLLITGLAVEVALTPFALYHFHKAGLYGVFANVVAIPLTTFVIMPLEAGALLLDGVGFGGPLWRATGWSIELILALARGISSAEGAVAMLPTMPRWAFAMMILGGLWLCLWNGKERVVGLIPFAIGIAGAATAPVPTILVTGDGQHLALVRADGVPVLLRSRSGDFVRDLMSEASAYDGEPANLDEQAFARCSRDACVADIAQGTQAWRLLAIRSRERIDWMALVRACRDADIVVSDRRLPLGCTPRWLKLDRAALQRTGGVAIYLDGSPRVETVSARLGDHPWRWRSVTPPARPPTRSPTDR